MNALMTEYQDCRDAIHIEMTKATQSFVKIGFFLRKMKEEKLYQAAGYKDINELAQAEFGIDRSTATRFMQINAKYSINNNSIELREEYKRFGSSKLVEMLNMPENLIEEIPETITVSEIREIKKEMVVEEEEQLPGQANILDYMSQEKQDFLTKLVEEYFLDRNINNAAQQVVYSTELPGMESKEKRFRIAINPSKFKFFTLEGANCLLKEHEVVITPLKGEKEVYSYGEVIKKYIEIWPCSEPKVTREEPKKERSKKEEVKEEKNETKEDVTIKEVHVDMEIETVPDIVESSKKEIIAEDNQVIIDKRVSRFECLMQMNIEDLARYLSENIKPIMFKNKKTVLEWLKEEKE